jgi:hypothetical protein
MAGAGKKTFTAGEVLTASDVNTYLMEQSVMVFGGTAARSSAIPTPSTGMTTYIGTTGTATIPQIETYTGSQWQTPYGLTLVANVPFSGASTANINNVFSATYDRYYITGTYIPSGSAYLVMKLRDAGGDLTNNYVNNVSTQSADNGHNNAVTANIQGSYYNPAARIGFGFDLINPFLSVTTLAHGMTYYDNSTDTFGASYLLTTSCTGISIMPSTGTFTGTVRIYGYRNS